MAIEFGPPIRKALFRWLKPQYQLRNRLTAPSHFAVFANRIDFLFRDGKRRKIGIVGRNLRAKTLAGLGSFAWGVSEGATFEMAEGTLDGVILVVLVGNASKARKARAAIVKHVCTQVPQTLANDLLVGYVKKNKFVPAYLERAIF